ncbi:MAG: hypothetical protein HY209_06855 [Candidatus Omnitrophica bacterium]|nr:hypothetical protein [Candidatus Omnitrophota bacterium]
MVFLYSTLIMLVCFLILVNIYRIRLLDDARRRGKLPQKGKATMYDVRHLLMEGEKDLATQLYCEIFNVSLPRAKKDIEELQRSLKV